MPGGRFTGGRPVRGAGDAESEVVRGAEAERPVEKAQAAVAVDEVAVGDQAAQVRSVYRSDIARPMKRLRIAAEGGIARIVEVAWGFVARRTARRATSSLLAGQLHAVLRIDDGARVDEGHRATDLEDAGALEEERAELGIEQREPLVGFDLRLVGFHLREVGVQREVRRHVRGDAVLDVDPGVGVGSRVAKPPVDSSIDPNCTAVKVGRNSRLRLVDRLVMPSRSPICR